jgi:hypothetical protein
MTIIEVEGTNVQPLLVDSLDILAGACALGSFFVVLIDVKTGQRYSVVVRLSLLSLYRRMCLTFL